MKMKTTACRLAGITQASHVQCQNILSFPRGHTSLVSANSTILVYEHPRGHTSLRRANWEMFPMGLAPSACFYFCSFCLLLLFLFHSALLELECTGAQNAWHYSACGTNIRSKDLVLDLEMCFHLCPNQNPIPVTVEVLAGPIWSSYKEALTPDSSLT